MKTLLSLDGGGAKALRTIQVLKYIEASTGKRCVDLFDLIAGTSAGGICALALTRQQPMSAVDLEKFYLELCPKIFTRSAWHAVKTLGGVAGPKYDVRNLQAALAEPFSAARPMGLKALVCMYNLAEAKPYQAFGQTQSQLSAIDAALMTSAAPTYFAPHTYATAAWWDGGVCTNNPSMIALAYLGQPDKVLALSLGTGAAQEGWSNATAQGWSLLGQLPAILDAAMDGAAQQSHEAMQHIMPAGQYLRVQQTFTNSAMDDASVKNLAALQIQGEYMVQQQKPRLDELLQRIVARS